MSLQQTRVHQQYGKTPTMAITHSSIGTKSMTFSPPRRGRRWPPELGIFLVLVGICAFFEALGWAMNGQSFVFNLERLQIIILQMAVIGIIAVGVNLVIITSGIDVGAKAEIHRLVCELAKQGVAVLMISSEMPEVLGMSDRVLVMREGRLVAEFDRAQATSEAVGAAMMGEHPSMEMAA